MELSELKAEMDEQFRHVREQFKQVDQQFKRVDQRFAQVDQRFVELRQEIAAESEKTRRHFDVVFGQMKAERNLALDAVVAADERLVRMSASNASEHGGFEASTLSDLGRSPTRSRG